MKSASTSNKFHFGILGMMALLMIFMASCSKTELNPVPEAAGLNNDEVRIAGKVFILAKHFGTQCTAMDKGNNLFYRHSRTVSYGSGGNLNRPDLTLTLSSIPPNGETTVYTLDAGGWMHNSGTKAAANLACISLSNYMLPDNKTTATLTSNSSSGTISVSSDKNGNIEYNFSNVSLTYFYGDRQESITIDAKNMLCE
jgi:hypothetical protein